MDATPNAGPPKSRRRWYQFALRTLLIGVALLALPCAWLAREAHVVAERKAWLAQHPEAAVVAVEPSAVWWLNPRDPQKSPSTLRRWLGDKAVAWRYVNEEVVSSVVALFTEANTMRSYGDRGPVEAWLVRACQ